MPYKFETNHIKLPKDKDRRVKLSLEDKTIISELYKTGNYSQRTLAKQFNVSRRTIQFIIDSSKLEQNKLARELRGGYMTYYDKDKNTEYIRNHRKYKKTILEKESE